MKKMALLVVPALCSMTLGLEAVGRSKPRTSFSFAARKFYVSNESDKTIEVRATVASGDIQTIVVKPGEVGQFKWRYGAWNNIQKVAVRPEAGSIFGRGSEDEIVVPEWRQGEVWPSAHLTYKGLGDYTFQRRWRVRAPKFVKQDAKGSQNSR